jgi:hypothetical protein
VIRFILVVAIIGLMLPSIGLAEFYKYRDASGVMRFTDNLAEVPRDQRPKVTSYSEPDDFLTPEERRQKAAAEAQAEAAAQQTSETRFEDVMEERMRLNQLRLDLDAEYGELMKEKQALEDMRKEISDEAGRIAYKERVITLNERITDYEAQRIAFEEAMEVFNQSGGGAE